jgi:hypothetical protein
MVTRDSTKVSPTRSEELTGRLLLSRLSKLTFRQNSAALEQNVAIGPVIAEGTWPRGELEPTCLHGDSVRIRRMGPLSSEALSPQTREDVANLDQS